MSRVALRYEKPFLSIEQQIALLKSRGMVIDGDVAQGALEHIGYYRLSAYWYPFRVKVGNVIQDDFIEGTQFRTVLELYKFDKALRSLTFSAISEIETSLRTSIARVLGTRDPWAHRKPQHLHSNFSRRRRDGRTIHECWLQQIDKQEDRSKDIFVDHYRSKYTATPHLPIWMSVEVWDMGTLSRLVPKLKYQDQKLVAESHGVSDPSVFASWTRALTFVRNVCAHHGRLWNRSLVDSPRLSQNDIFDSYRQSSARQRIYPTLLALGIMLDAIGAGTDWADALENLIAAFPESEIVDVRMMGRLPA